MKTVDLDYARIFDAGAPAVTDNAQAAPTMTLEQIAKAQAAAEVRAIGADLEKIKRVALDAVRVSMDELRRTLLAATAAPQVNADRVFEVGTAMRAR